MNQIVPSLLPLDASVQLGETLTVSLVDRRPESVDFFTTFNLLQRGELAKEAWQIGLRALESAQASANSARLEDIGKALLVDVQARLRDHVDAQTRDVEAQLRGFLDPKDGRLMQRLDGLLKDGGELARLLQHHTGPGSKLQTTLTSAINPLLRSLSPSEHEGIVLTLKRQVAEVLQSSQQAVQEALDPVNPQGAASRFLVGLSEQLKSAGAAQERRLAEVTAALDANNDQSLLSRLLRETRAAQERVLVALNPSDEKSLLAPLKRTIEDLLSGYQRQQMAAIETQRERQAAFEKTILEKVTRLETRKDALRRGVKAGQDFEVHVYEFVHAVLSGGPYEVDFTAHTAATGSRRKVGDVVVTFNAESRFAGSRIVLEAKDREQTTQKKALEELTVAREIRGAQVGVFVLSSAAGPSCPGFPAFMRCGCDILVQWHPEDPASDAYLHAAILLALALAARLQRHAAVDELKELETLEKLLTTHLQRVETLRRKAKMLLMTANEMVGELNASVGEVSEMANGLKGLLRSARAEEAGDVEFGGDGVGAVNQFGVEGMPLPAA
ncbi:MAG: hypothetical protein K1X87_11435 [Dehalococcoidia bacterium]|nr:hypothetical protein [Dehalococcoidia bacterium]